MSDNIFELGVAQVQHQRWSRRDEPTHTNHVRCYRSSPDRITLQIRSLKGYSTVSLPFDVAKNIAQALIQEAGE